MTQHALQLPLGVRWLRAPDFSVFVAESNAELLDTLNASIATPGVPLFIHGASGSGKTHLLQAAARQAHAQGRRTAYLSLSCGSAMLAGYEDFDFVCVDTAEDVARDHDLALALLRLMDQLKATSATLVIASRRDLDQLVSGISADLHTRLRACNVHGIKPLSDDGLALALQRQARARGLKLDAAVANYIVRRIPRGMNTLIALLERLDRASLSTGRRLTIPFVQQQLQRSDERAARTSAQTTAS